MNNIHWLPELFPVNPWTEQTIECLYKIFSKDFIESFPHYDGNRVWIFPEKDSGKELIFWHLITKDDNKAQERLPDFRRAERLPWARPSLDSIPRFEILNWDYEEGDGVIHTYVWLKDYDYLVILKKYKDSSRRLITAYWIEYENYKKKLRNKYERRILRS